MAPIAHVLRILELRDNTLGRSMVSPDHRGDAYFSVTLGRWVVYLPEQQQVSSMIFGIQLQYLFS